MSDFTNIENIISDARNGKMYILVDSEDRENEGCLLYTSDAADDP